MRLRESLEAVAAISPEAFEDLRRDVDPEWIVQALKPPVQRRCARVGYRPSKLSGWSSGWRCSGIVRSMTSSPSSTWRCRAARSPLRRARWSRLEPVSVQSRWSGCSRSPTGALDPPERSHAQLARPGALRCGRDAPARAGLTSQRSALLIRPQRSGRKRLPDGPRRRAHGAPLALAGRGAQLSLGRGRAVSGRRSRPMRRTRRSSSMPAGRSSQSVVARATGCSDGRRSWLPPRSSRACVRDRGGH